MPDVALSEKVAMSMALASALADGPASLPQIGGGSTFERQRKEDKMREKWTWYQSVQKKQVQR